VARYGHHDHGRGLGRSLQPGSELSAAQWSPAADGSAQNSVAEQRVLQQEKTASRSARRFNTWLYTTTSMTGAGPAVMDIRVLRVQKFPRVRALSQHDLDHAAAAAAVLT